MPSKSFSLSILSENEAENGTERSGKRKFKTEKSVFLFLILVNNLPCRFLVKKQEEKNKTSGGRLFPSWLIPMMTACNVQSLHLPGGGESTITPPCSPPDDVMEIEEGELLDDNDTAELDEIRCGEDCSVFLMNI